MLYNDESCCSAKCDFFRMVVCSHYAESDATAGCKHNLEGKCCHAAAGSNTQETEDRHIKTSVPYTWATSKVFALTIVSLALILMLILSVTGCSPKFACSDDIYSGEPRCNSVSAMYNTKMRGGEDPAAKTAKDAESGDDTLAKAKPDLKPVPNPSQAAAILKSMSYGSKAPIRVPPKIIRIWIAPWEDSDGDLYQPGYVFSEINDKRGRWIYGERETSASQTMLKAVEKVESEGDDKDSRSSTQKEKKEKAERATKPSDKSSDQPALKLRSSTTGQKGREGLTHPY
jgi:conjugal transfer pilus assembly protein TraV